MNFNDNFTDKLKKMVHSYNEAKIKRAQSLELPPFIKEACILLAQEGKNYYRLEDEKLYIYVSQILNTKDRSLIHNRINDYLESFKLHGFTITTTKYDEILLQW